MGTVGVFFVFYQWYEVQRWAAGSALGTTDVVLQPMRTWLPMQLALFELLNRLAHAGEPVAADLGEYVRADAGGPLDATARTLGPHVTAWRFRSARGNAAPVVFVPPCSGYVAGVASPLIATLLRHRPVLALDWQDARLVPADAGLFHLTDQIAAVETMVHEAGPGAVVVGLSQSVTAAVAGAALAAKAGARPAALILLAGPFDTREGVHPLTTLLRLHPPHLLESQFTTRVPGRFPGAGRRVYPGLMQLWAYALGCPRLYLECNLGLFAELTSGSLGPHAREHRDLHSLTDVAAELFTETVAAVYREHALVRNLIRVDGRHADLEALAGVQLLTVEMTADELVGKGHTHAAVDHIRHAGARRVTVEGGQHHEVFTGERFFAAVAPHLDELLMAA